MRLTERLFVQVSGILLCAFAGLAQQQAPPAASTAAEVPLDDNSMVKITISLSRSPSVLGTNLGVSAAIRNISKIPLRFYEHETVFVVPPETRIYGVARNLFQGCAAFPTQGIVRNPGAQPPDRRGWDIVIRPGESYRVFWDFGTDGCSGDTPQVVHFWPNPVAWFSQVFAQRVMFSPGPYKVALTAVFHEATAGADDRQYHTASELTEVTLSASQGIILLGAFLGGLLAWLVKRSTNPPSGAAAAVPAGPGPAGPGDENLAGRLSLPLFPQVPSLVSVLRQYSRPAVEASLQGLLSFTLVIIASRLPDTFPVKVNANDFWGAITLGFVANFSGLAMLRKLPGLSPQPSGAPGAAGPATTPGTPAGGAGPSMVPDVAPAAAQASAAAAAGGEGD